MKPVFSAPHVLGATSILTISVFLTLAAIAFPQPLLAQQCELTIGAPACSSQTDAGSSSPAYLPKSYVGNPVDVVTGNKYQHADDYLAFGSRLQFSRHYNSADHDKRNTLGHGWRHSFDVKLKRASASRLLIKQSDGRIVEFISDSAKSKTYKARHNSDGYVEMSDLSRWVLPTGKTLSFKGSYLVEIAFDDGKALKLFYKDKKLSTVTDHFGRKITLSYYQPKKTLGSYGEKFDGSSPGSLESVELPDGSLVKYQYDKQKNLVTVSYPEGTQSQYKYTDPDYHHHLTGANEAIESNQKHWEYDQYGRATKYTNQRAELAMDIDYIPKTDENKQHRTRVKTNDGRQEEYTWQHSDKLKLPVVTEYKEIACTDCAPTQQQFTHESVVNWAPENKVADKATSDEKVTYALDASQGSLGAEVSMGEGQYQVSVDRLGKLRDISDGIDSLSDAATRLFNSQATDKKVDLNKVDKMLRVKNSAIQTRAWPSSTEHYCDEDPVSAERSCEELKHDYDLAELSACVYLKSPEDQVCSNGYSRYTKVDPAATNIPAQFFEFSGYKAALYQSGDGEFVLVFKGTEIGADWFNNIEQAFGKSSDYYESAKKLVQWLYVAGYNFDITGHSLGGGLATAAAMVGEREATVFNAAAVHPNTIPNYWNLIESAEDHIVSYTVEGDIVSGAQDFLKPNVTNVLSNNVLEGFTNEEWEQVQLDSDGGYRNTAAPGARVYLESPPDEWVEERQGPTGTWPFESIIRHGMEAVLYSLDAKIQAQCNSQTEAGSS